MWDALARSTNSVVKKQFCRLCLRISSSDGISKVVGFFILVFRRRDFIIVWVSGNVRSTLQCTEQGFTPRHLFCYK